jgi:hypothetical protein
LDKPLSIARILKSLRYTHSRLPYEEFPKQDVSVFHDDLDKSNGERIEFS